MKKLKFLLLLFLPFISEGQKSFRIADNNIISAFDTCENKQDVNTLSNFHNIRFSRSYTILDTLALDSQAIVILSPLEEKSFCSIAPKRLFVLLKKGDAHTYKIQLVSENIVPNNVDHMNEPYKGIELSEDGFLMKVATGSIIKCDHIVFFKRKNGHFFLNNVAYDCYKTDLSSSKNGNKTYSISKENRIEHVKIRNVLFQPKL